MDQSLINRLCGTALEKTDLGVAVATTGGDVVFLNAKMKQLLPPDGHKRLGPAFDGLAESLNGNAGTCLVIAEVNGTPLSLQGIRVADEQNGNIYYCIVARESGRGEAEVRSIFDTFADGYYETDVDGAFIYVNKTFCSLTGYESDALVGKNFRMLFDDPAIASVMETIKGISHEPTGSRIVNWELLRNDRKKRSVEVSLSMMRHPDGSIIGYRGILRDITARKRMEEEILLARKIEAIGIMAGGIAHDYNNALTAILGNLSLAKMEAKPEEKELLDVLNDAEAAAMRVLDLTKRLSSFARGGKPKMVRVSRDIMTDVIRDTIDAVLKDYPGTWKLTVAEDLWQAEIDPVQFSHVIEHVVNNAREAMPAGGDISVEVSNDKVEKGRSFQEISLYPDNYVRISVTDRGDGISGEIIDKIYDPYFTTKEMATGMGLTICYAIVKRHHGYIDVRSGDGKGTCVSIFIPVVKD